MSRSKVRFVVATRAESRKASLKFAETTTALRSYVDAQLLAAVARAICPSVPSVKATEGRG